MQNLPELELKRLGVIQPVWYHDLKEAKVSDERPRIMMVAKNQPVDMEEFYATIAAHRPHNVVGPWKIDDIGFTSMAAERIRAQMPREHYAAVGTVVAGEDHFTQIDYLFWAVENAYLPIVILPDPKLQFQRLLYLYHNHRGLSVKGWYHLHGRVETSFDPSLFPGAYSWSEEPEYENI